MANYRSFLQAAGESRGPCVPRTAQAFAEASHGGIAAATRHDQIARVMPLRSTTPSKFTLPANRWRKPRHVFPRMAQASADDRMRERGRGD